MKSKSADKGAEGGGRMRKITGATDAENRAREFMGDRRPRAKGVIFRRTWREGDLWLVEGEFWFRRAHFFTVTRSFRLQISVEDGELMSYEEKKH